MWASQLPFPLTPSTPAPKPGSPQRDLCSLPLLPWVLSPQMALVVPSCLKCPLFPERPTQLFRLWSVLTCQPYPILLFLVRCLLHQDVSFGGVGMGTLPCFVPQDMSSTGNQDCSVVDSGPMIE